MKKKDGLRELSRSSAALITGINSLIWAVNRYTWLSKGCQRHGQGMTRRPDSLSVAEALNRVDAAVTLLVKLIAHQVVMEGQALAFQNSEDQKNAENPATQR